MVTKIKPYRIRDVNEPEEGNSLQYNDPNTFVRGEGGGGGSYVAGENIQINGNVISATDTTYIAGRNVEIVNGAGGDETVTGNTSILLEDAIADGLNSVTISGKTKQSYLPDGYTEYEYIHTSGKYFVTDYYPNNKTEVKTKIFMDGQPGSPLVTRWTTSPTNDTFGFYMGNVANRLTFFYGTYNNSKYTNVEGVKTNMEHSIYMGVSSIILDGTSYSTTRDTFTSTQPIYIGAFNQTGTSLAGTLAGRIYKVEFIENGNVVRRYIPCKNANNEIGLYETATSTFITSAGTGNIKSGKIAEKSDTLPSTYTRLEYIQATGTQYIDSGVVGNFATNKIEQNAVVEYTTSNSDRELMGTNGYGFWGKSASNKIEAALGQTTVTDNALVKNNISWTTDPDGNKLTLNVNSNQYTSTASSFVDADYAYYIFALGIRVGSGSSASFFCKAKVYSYTIAIDDEVVCDLVPCKRNSDNVLGMYDLVNGTFKTNAGTGTFTAGGIYSTLNPSNPQPIICNNGELKLGGHGKNLFNKDSIPYLSGAYINSATIGQSTFNTTTNANYNVYCIEIKPNTTYTFGLIKANDPRWVVTDGSIILDAGTNSGGSAGIYKTITTGATAKYLYLSVAISGSYKCDDVLQVEEGSEHTEYEAFHYVLVAEGITETVEDELGNTATAENLLAVGEYKDTHEILSGEVTRKVGVIVLNGTEEWTYESQYSRFYTSFTPDAIANPVSRSIPAYCSHFEMLSNGEPFSDVTQGQGYLARTSEERPSWVYFHSSLTSVAQFTQWLASQYNAGTPVIIVYPLATETTETVTGQTLTTIQGNNTITITQASIDNLPIEANYDKIGGLTINFVNDDGFQTISNMKTDLSSPDDTHYPTTKAVADAIQGAGGGDMMASTYDPNNIGADAFDYDNFINTPTDLSDFNNDVGYLVDDDILSKSVYPSSKVFSNESANGYIETVGTYTLTTLNKVDIIQKCCHSGSNYYTGVRSPFLILYKDANNYFGIERQGYKLRLINVVNGSEANNEEWSSGINTLNTYLNIYLSLNLSNKKMTIVGSNGTPTTLFTFDFSSWSLSALDTFKIRTSGGKYLGYQYNVYLRTNDYYDYESILNLKFQVNSYNTLPIIAYGEGNYTPTTLYIEGSNIVTTSDTHKTADVSINSLDYLMLTSGYDDLMDKNYVSSLVKFRITSGSAEIHAGVGITSFLLMNADGSILYNGIGASENYTLTNNTWYYLYVVGVGNQTYNYTRRYNTKVQGTFTIEAEALAIGYPRSMNCCAETFDGQNFSGTIPMTSDKTSFTDVTFTNAMNGYQVPVGAIYVDSGVMYIYNGTAWIDYSKFIVNKATGTDSLTIFGTATTAANAINIGATSSMAGGSYSVGIGYGAKCNSSNAIAIGRSASVGSNARDVSAIGYNARIAANANYAIQIGNGQNSTANSLAIGFDGTNYTLLDGSTGLIPDDRISTNIARTANLGTAATKDTGTSSGNVPVLDSNGHLANSTIPGVALTDTFTVSTSSDLTTLSSADQGDIAIVTSENKTYVLSQAPYSTAANWKQILSPTGGVTSVNGQTGAVTLSIPTKTSDITNDSGYLTSSTGVTSVNGSHGAVTVNEPIVSATAPSSPTEGMIWYDTTNDVVKVYDGTNWVEVGKEYNAGTGISIGNVTKNGRQGPSPDGFHVPEITEWQGLKTIMDGLSLTTGDSWRINLHMPFAGAREYIDGAVYDQGNWAHYWSSSPRGESDPEYAWYLLFSSNYVDSSLDSSRADGQSLRCFKDSYVTPDSTWTVVQGTLGSAGIFWNQSEGLISITDGTTGYTIMDKNLGATAVYNNGDTLSEANCGKYYQRGNNYGFAWTGTISSTSSTQVDASAYGPTNPYSSDTFITGSDDWSSVHNDDLWGDTTETYTLENVISNTGVLSVNGQTGAVTVPVGDVVGPNSATDGHLAVFDGATGKLIKDGGAMPTIPSISTITVTLAAANWSSKSITVSATGVTASNTVIVAPDPSSMADYTDGGVYCSSQASNSLTFVCDTEPSNDIDVNVVILG